MALLYYRVIIISVNTCDKTHYNYLSHRSVLHSRTDIYSGLERRRLHRVDKETYRSLHTPEPHDTI